MSVWTNINGTIKIHQKNKVSIPRVLEDAFTDEVVVSHNTNKEGEYYKHNIDANLSIDGDEFCKKYEEFISKLKAESIDITCTIRFLR